MTLQQVLTENRNKVIAGLKNQFEFQKIELSVVMTDFLNYLISEEWTSEELSRCINFQKSFDQLLSCFSSETNYSLNMRAVGSFQEEQMQKQAKAAGIL